MDCKKCLGWLAKSISRFFAGGTVWLETPVWDDIIINPSNLRVGTSAPSFVDFNGGIYALSFTNAQTDVVYGAFEMPHGYKEGTQVEIHVHWTPSTSNTGECIFLFKYSVGVMGGVFSSPQSFQIKQNAGGVLLKHQYASGGLFGSGLGIGSIITFELSRPMGDGFTGDAFVHSIGVHYQVDTMGSRQMGVK